MYFSATSYLMAIFSGNCLICFLYIIMHENCIAEKLSIPFLKYFSLFILLRLMLPFEFFHTITIPSYYILPVVIDFFNEHVFFTIKSISFTPFRLFLIIWIGGGSYLTYKAFRRYQILYGIIRCFPNLLDISDSDLSTIMKAVYKANPIRYPVKKVIRTKYVAAPCVLGFFSPIVFLPDFDFTKEELYCILNHELSHLRHRDLIWMIFIEFLCIVNWWNPFIVLLRKRIKDIMEFHADEETYVLLPLKQRTLYLDCLVKVSRNQQNTPSLPIISLPFTDNTYSSLKCRILRLISQKPYKSFVNNFIRYTACLLIFVSTLFIAEPCWKPEEELRGEVFSMTDESYLIKRTDGTYGVYIDNEHFMGVIRNPDIDEIRDLPVYYDE